MTSSTPPDPEEPIAHSPAELAAARRAQRLLGWIVFGLILLNLALIFALRNR